RRQQQPRQYLLASGPGNANIRRSVQAGRVSWQVGCGSIDARHLKALERLERLAITGELTPEPVLLWYVADLIVDVDASTSAVDGGVGGGYTGRGSPRLRRNANLYSGRSFLSDSAAVPSSVSESSGFASPPMPTRPPPQPPVPTRRIELPTVRSTPTTTPTTPAPTTTTERGIQQLVQLSAQPYSFPVGVLTRIVLMPNARQDSLLAELTTSVTGCGHANALGVFGRYIPEEMVLEGHPTAKDIGSQHKCSLHVRDSGGKQAYIGFTIRVPEPKPPQRLLSIEADKKLFRLILGLRYNRLIDPADYFAHALAHDIRICVSPIRNRCVGFSPQSPLQFNATTSRVYGLAWRKQQLTALPTPVYLLATSKYNKTAVLTVGYKVTESRTEDYAHQNKVNHEYRLHVESQLDYLRKLETETAPLYSIIEKIGKFLSTKTKNVVGIIISSSRLLPETGIHLKWLNRTDSRSRSMVLVFGCIINYGINYCPRLSIIEEAKKMFRYCKDSKADGQPWPDFAAALAPHLTPIQLIDMPLGTCTSSKYEFPMRYYLASPAACPDTGQNRVTTPDPMLPPQPIWPPTFAPSSSRSGLRVNYVTTKEHGVYCLLPFSTSAGSGFSRPIKRLGCVNDSYGNNLRVLPLQLCTHASDDGEVCSNANKFIAWNATIRGFEGIPFDADVGPKQFVVLVRSTVSPNAPPVRFNLSVVVEQPQWGPFRFHRVRIRIAVDRYRVADLNRQYRFFRQLNDLVSAALSGNKVYMRLPPDDLQHQLKVPGSVVNFTVDWTVVGYDSDGAVIDGFGKYRIFCPVDQLVILRRVASEKLAGMLISNAIGMHTLEFLLEGNCSSYNYGDLFRLYDNYMQSHHPINTIVPDYPAYPGGGGSDNAIVNKNAAGGSNDVETASIGDSNVLLITVAPACGLVLLALLVALLVACCLYKRKPANSRGGQQQQQQRSRHVSYQQQQQQQQQ
uniref:Piwi domain-containing protein n=2 Tax=Macrostomum lignano TaxID=282301 RepID=A0A1I8HGY2_9PLAT